MTGEADQTAVYSLGIAIILAALLLSASVYFSVNGLADVISKKPFTVTVQGGVAANAGAAQGAANAGAAQGAAANPPGAQDAQPTAAAQPPPTPVKVAIDVKGAHVKGPSSPKVTVVEFSDFECPYCGLALPTVKSIESDYKDSAQLVFMNFPLSFHPNAQKAAEAGECAADQGKFWEMHDRMFANQQALGVDRLREYAKNLSLDTAKFDACLDSGNKTAKVKADASVGSGAGVGGTPSFFIYAENRRAADADKMSLLAQKVSAAYNGQVTIAPLDVDGKGYGLFFAGALPYDTFKQAIDALSG